MKLNEVIRTRRQTLGLTQEQLAQALGVSAPGSKQMGAESKLPGHHSAARAGPDLGVDMNTLLSFQEDLTTRRSGNS